MVVDYTRLDTSRVYALISTGLLEIKEEPEQLYLGIRVAEMLGSMIATAR